MFLKSHTRITMFHFSGKNEEETENLKILKESIKDVSPYVILLNRLDEEEGVRTPSIEDKLKLAVRICLKYVCCLSPNSYQY